MYQINDSTDVHLLTYIKQGISFCMKRWYGAITLIALSTFLSSWIVAMNHPHTPSPATRNNGVVMADGLIMLEDGVAEEGGADGAIVFRLENGAIAPSDITITFDINPTVTNAAINGVDFETLPTTIILLAGQSEVRLVIKAIDDNIIEGDENLEFRLVSAFDQGGISYLGTQRGITTKIIDNDNRISIRKTIDGKELGSGNASDGEFRISLPGSLTFNEEVRVEYTRGGTATGGPGTTYDYNTTNLTGVVVLPANTNSVALPIRVNDDLLIEGDETVEITIKDISYSAVSNLQFTYEPTARTGTVIIEDDDYLVSFGVLETKNGTEPGTLPEHHGYFEIGWPNGENATVPIFVSCVITGTATSNVDYRAIAVTQTIPAGTSKIRIPVTVLDDDIVEGPETVILTITRLLGSGAPPLTIGTNSGTVTIEDDDRIVSQQWKSAAYTGTGVGGAVKAGELITYSIHVRNPGNVTLTNVRISDVIPANTIFVSADGGITPDGTGRLTWTIASMAKNTPDVVRSFIVRVANDLTGVTNITNTAVVNNGDGDHPTTPPDPGNPNNPHPNPDPNDPSTDVPVDNGGKRSDNWKSASYTGTGADGKVKPGDLITYTVHVRNTGNVRLTNVVISDKIPDYTVFVSADGGVTPDGTGTLIWTIADIPVGGADVTRNFVVRVANDLTGANSIINTAGVNNGDGNGDHPTTPPATNNPNNPHPNPNPNDPSTDVPVDNSKQSVNWKSASYVGTGTDGMVKAGDEITYTIHIRNTGNVSLTNVRISDAIPTYTELISADEGITPDATGTLIWTIPSVAVGAPDVLRSFRVRVVNDLTNAGYIINTAYVDNGNGGGNNPTFPPATNDPNNPHPNPDPNDPSTKIDVDNGSRSDSWKSAAYTGTGANGGVTTGDLIVYTIHVRNTGNATLTNVVMTDNIPAYTEFVSAEEGKAPVAGKLTWTIASIPVGAADVTRSFTVRVVQDLTGATSIVNTAGVDNGNGKGVVPSNPSVPGDPNNPAPNPGGGPATSIDVDTDANFDTWKSVVTVSGAIKATPGEVLVYTIHIRNTGNTTIPVITIVDPVPVHTIFQSATNDGVFSVADNTVTWSVRNIAVGAMATVTFRVKADENLDDVTAIVNTATASDGIKTTPTSSCDPALPDCSGTTGTSIDADPGLALLIFANAMSPNGDGKNDYFIIKGLDKYPPSALYVFNRWGNMVYQSKAYNNDWDGKGLSEGVYYYKLELQLPQGTKLYKGWVVLKRN
jgi:gliding motility-associated-like protein/uncharacterized repeat protein (TIGR01451 family)